MFAVDACDIAKQARQVVTANGFDDVITVIQGRVEEIVLPVEKVDVIISEWMGYCERLESLTLPPCTNNTRFFRSPRI